MTRVDGLAALASPLVLVTLLVQSPASGVVLAQRPPQPTRQVEGGLEVLQLRPNFYMIAGAGGNIGVQTGPDGMVVVDTGSADKADAVVAAIAQLSDRPIRYEINTSASAHHVGGNEKVARAGRTIFQMTNALAAGLTNQGAASILAAEDVLRRMSAPTGETAPFPAAAWPTETFHQRRSYMRFNGEAIETLRQPAAHSDGDSIVFFRQSDVVVAGDVLDATAFPVIDVDRGGSIQGEISALNALVELAVPNFPLVWQEGGTLVIPGHGHVYEQLDVVEYRDMLTVIRDRIQALIDKGQTLAQVKAASPTRGYTAQYGASSGSWTTDMFVEAVYRGLAGK